MDGSGKLIVVEGTGQKKKRPISLGQKFGLLMVTAAGSSKGGRRYWVCQCACGNLIEVATGSLNIGNTRSCGCTRAANLTTLRHGNARRGKPSPEYRAWCAMLKRCYAPCDKHYKDYGGRGIRVCARWRTSFEEFLADVGPKPAPTYTLDRIENDGDYEPDNVRWATPMEQASNRRNVNIVAFDGKKLTVAAWERELGFRPGTVKARLRLGWNTERALTTTTRAHV